MNSSTSSVAQARCDHHMQYPVSTAAQATAFGACGLVPHGTRHLLTVKERHVLREGAPDSQNSGFYVTGSTEEITVDSG